VVDLAVLAVAVAAEAAPEETANPTTARRATAATPRRDVIERFMERKHN
jgi:hypothetical protein